MTHRPGFSPQRRQRRPERAKSSRWRPDTAVSSPKGATPSVTVQCARPHSATRRCSLPVAAKKRKLGENQAPLQRVVGAFVHKRREDGSGSLTTLHTTPLPSPHTELSPSRAHSLSLPAFTSPVQRARELLQPWRLPCFSCCCWPCSLAQVISSGSARCSALSVVSNLSLFCFCPSFVCL